MIKIEFCHKDLLAAKEHARGKQERNGAFTQRALDPLRDYKCYLSELAVSDYFDDIGYHYHNHPPVTGNVSDKYDKVVEIDGNWVAIDVKATQGRKFQISQYQIDKAVRNKTLFVFVHLDLKENVALVKGWLKPREVTREGNEPFEFEGKRVTKYLVYDDDMNKFKHNNTLINRLWSN